MVDIVHFGAGNEGEIRTFMGNFYGLDEADNQYHFNDPAR